MERSPWLLLLLRQHCHQQQHSVAEPRRLWRRAAPAASASPCDVRFQQTWRHADQTRGAAAQCSLAGRSKEAPAHTGSSGSSIMRVGWAQQRHACMCVWVWWWWWWGAGDQKGRGMSYGLGQAGGVVHMHPQCARLHTAGAASTNIRSSRHKQASKRRTIRPVLPCSSAAASPASAP